MSGEDVRTGTSNAAVHLVGSINLSGPEEVFRECGERVGKLVGAVPDGEAAYRQQWIQHIAYTVLYPNTSLKVVQRPMPPAWYSSSLKDQWVFEVKSEYSELELGPLGYAAAAEQAYGLLLRLREEGAVPREVGLQVSIPSIGSGIAPFAVDERSERILRTAYKHAVKAEVGRLVEAVPASELSIQWDVAIEVSWIVGANPSKSPEEAWQYYTEELAVLSDAVPSEAALGYHLCYGSWENKHFADPDDLEVSVQMANIAVEESVRPVDYVHMTVPISRTDDGYFAPLEALTEDIGRLYLGLVHVQDGLDGAQQRIAAARRHYSRPFGVSTECGMGRFSEEESRQALTLHAEIARSAAFQTR